MSTNLFLTWFTDLFFENLLLWDFFDTKYSNNPYLRNANSLGLVLENYPERNPNHIYNYNCSPEQRKNAHMCTLEDSYDNLFAFNNPRRLKIEIFLYTHCVSLRCAFVLQWDNNFSPFRMLITKYMLILMNFKVIILITQQSEWSEYIFSHSMQASVQYCLH